MRITSFHFVLTCFSRTEFDDWYNERYSNGGHQPGVSSHSSSSSNANQYDYRFHDDPDERFDSSHKELLASDLDSMPFRQAQARTNRRVSVNLTSKRKHTSSVFSSLQHIFDGAENQATWKPSATTTTIRVNSDSHYPSNYGQDPTNFSSMPMNGGRQKPMVR